MEEKEYSSEIENTEMAEEQTETAQPTSVESVEETPTEETDYETIAQQKKTIKNCSLCGMCKSVCPVYQVRKTEIDSPRGKAILKKAGRLDMKFYDCSLCGACTEACASSVPLCDEFRDSRNEIVKLRADPKAVKIMIANIKKYGNPYGEVKEGETPKELYCC